MLNTANIGYLSRIFTSGGAVRFLRLTDLLFRSLLRFAHSGDHIPLHFLERVGHWRMADESVLGVVERLMFLQEHIDCPFLAIAGVLEDVTLFGESVDLAV